MANAFENGQITAYGDRMQIFGLGSQWDTKSILEAELNILKLRQQPYVTKKNSYETEKQTWTSLKTSLTNFNNIVKNLRDLNTDSKNASLSEEGYISVSATGKSLDGSYSVEVEQLATKHRLMSDQLPTGELGYDETVQINNKDLVITADMDAKSIAKAINEGNYNVDAVVLNNQLVLTSKNSGENAEIKFSNSATWEAMGVTQSGIVKNELQEAKGSIFKVNGIQMTSETNSFTDIDGVNIQFKKETAGPIEVGISRSPEQVLEKLKAVVNAYNTVIDNINKLSGEKGALQGETITRSLKTQMGNQLFSINEKGSMLFELGITLNKTAKNGTISLDETKLKEMYSADPQKVQSMLTGPNGFAGKIYSVIDNYSKSNGIVQSEIDGLNNRIKRIDETLDRYDRQFEKQKESMIRKYATFETMMNSLNLQNDYLMAQLGVNNNNK